MNQVCCCRLVLFIVVKSIRAVFVCCLLVSCCVKKIVWWLSLPGTKRVKKSLHLMWHLHIVKRNAPGHVVRDLGFELLSLVDITFNYLN